MGALLSRTHCSSSFSNLIDRKLCAEESQTPETVYQRDRESMRETSTWYQRASKRARESMATERVRLAMAGI